MKFPILDLETTGLKVYPGAIMEVAITIMDTDFNTHGEFVSAVYGSPESLNPLMNDWALKTHTESGLLKECFDIENTPSLHTVEYRILELLDKYFPDERPVLVGNSIHFDRKFIDHHMPDLGQRLHYRMLDVSALWEYMRIFHGVKRPDNGPIIHRGLPDTRGSAKLLKQFKQYINDPNKALDELAEETEKLGLNKEFE
jgi:oligoribonuclease